MGRGTFWLMGLLVAVLVVVASGGVVAADETAASEPAVLTDDAERTPNATAGNTTDGAGAIDTTSAQTSTVTIEQEYRLTPDQPGQIDVQLQITVPDNVKNISTRLPDDATNRRVNGFERTDSGYLWERSEQSTTTPTLTYTTAANETGEVSGPIGADGRYRFVDAGDWALVEREPTPGYGLSYTGTQPTIERTNSTAGAGVVGQSMVFLGAHEEYTRSAHDQQFRLVVPDAATLAPSREDVFGTVTDASGRLQVGQRDPGVTIFVAPETVSWSVRGLQSGDRNFYAVADEPVDGPNNVWIHEYVHTRQDFETTEQTEWVTEASAEYYTGLLTLEQGRIEFDEFREYLSRGTYPEFSDAVLADPATWSGTGADYYTGALVTGGLDRQLRLTTDRSGTFQGVFQQLNQQSTAIGGADLLDAIESVGGSDVRTTARRYTATTERPSLWSQDEHATAFEPLPAQFAYTLPLTGSDGLRVRGPYRNRTLGAESLVTGETLVADVTVTNVGGVEGSYTQNVTLDGTPITTLRGTLRSGASESKTVRRTFSTPGEGVLSAGSDSLTVTVSEPGLPSVGSVSVNRTTVRGSGGVEVTAGVRTRGELPASGTISLRQDGEGLVERHVTLDRGETATVTATVRLVNSGTTTFAAGNRSAEVSVVDSTPTPETRSENGDGRGTDGADGAGESGPGFGPVGALVAIAVSLLVGYRIE